MAKINSTITSTDTQLTPGISATDSGDSSSDLQSAVDAYTQGGSPFGNGTFSMSGLVTALFELLSKSRNQSQDISEQQMVRQFTIQKSSMDEQQQGIDQQAEAGYLSGGLMIGGGAAALAGGAATAAGAGEVASSMGSAINSMLTGGGKVGEASLNAQGESTKVLSQYQSTLSQQFQKTVDNTVDQAKQVSSQMYSTNSQLVQLYGEMQKAVQF